MIEKTVRDHLTSQITGTDIFLNVPVNEPTEYISIEKIGGTDPLLVGRATFLIKAKSGASLLDAITLGKAVRAAMHSLADAELSVYSATLTSVYNNTDPDTKYHIDAMVYDVNFSEEE